MNTLLTRENQEGISYFYHITATNSTGRIRVHRNGKTKTWKTRPQEFKIPVKYGLRQCFYIIYGLNDHEWTID